MKNRILNFTACALLPLSFNALAEGDKQKQETSNKQKQESVKQNQEQGNEEPVIVVTTVATATATGCWATFFDENDYKGEQITLYDGIDLPEMKFADGTNWVGRVKSIQTGPNASLTLYGEELWVDKDFKVQPGSRIANFTKMPWNYVESVKMTCTP